MEKKDSLKALLNKYGGADDDGANIDTMGQLGSESTGGAAGGLFDGLDQNYSSGNRGGQTYIYAHTHTQKMNQSTSPRVNDD